MVSSSIFSSFPWPRHSWPAVLRDFVDVVARFGLTNTCAADEVGQLLGFNEKYKNVEKYFFTIKVSSLIIDEGRTLVAHIG